MNFDNEYDWVDWLKNLAGKKIPGMMRSWHEDASIWRCEGKKWLLSVDQFLENVHYRTSWMAPEDIGSKAVIRAVSDIWVKGGRPKWLWAAVTWPKGRKDDELQKLMMGIHRTAQSQGAKLVGGDTSRGERLSLCMVVLGTTKRRIVPRLGAYPRDLVWLTGPVGWAELGLQLCYYLDTNVRGSCPRPISSHLNEILSQSDLPGDLFPSAKKALHTFLRPALPIRHRPFLIHFAHSSIDTSDGFSIDLERLCRLNSIAAVINSALRPWNPQFTRLSQFLKLNPNRIVWSGGEDYQWIILAPRRTSAVVSRRWPKQVGKLCEGTPGLLDANGKPIRAQGWDMFSVVGHG